MPSKAARPIGCGCLGSCSRVVETAWLCRKWHCNRLVMSAMAAGAAALTCEQPQFALEIMVFICYKGVSTCHPARAQSPACGEASTGLCPLSSPPCWRRPFTISREDTELLLRWGILGDGSSPRRGQLAHWLASAHSGCSSRRTI